MIEAGGLDERKKLKGRVIQVRDAGYEEARSVWNGRNRRRHQEAADL